MDPFSRVFYGVLAVGSLAALGLGAFSAGGEGVAFSLFAILTIGGGLMCLWERSVVRSAFSLMATLLGVAGLFLLLGADFLAMAQVLIYVGGILALILFGVMLSPPDLSERSLPRVLGGLAFAGSAAVWLGLRISDRVNWSTVDNLPAVRSHAEEIGVGFLSPDAYLVPFELAAILLTVALVAAVYIARRKVSDLEPEETP